MKTKYTRYSRIIKHFIMYYLTGNVEHKYEIGHYYYMKSFKQPPHHQTRNY